MSKRQEILKDIQNRSDGAYVHIGAGVADLIADLGETFGYDRLNDILRAGLYALEREHLEGRRPEAEEQLRKRYQKLRYCETTKPNAGRTSRRVSLGA